MTENVSEINSLNLGLVAQQARFARLVGVSRQSISSKVKTGELPSNATYGEWLKIYCQSLRESAAGRPENSDELRAVTIREKLAKARQSEVATAKELGQLVRVDEVRVKLQVAFEHMSGILKTASQSIVDEIKLEYGVDIDPAIINKHHTAALSEISKFSRPVESDNG